MKKQFIIFSLILAPFIVNAQPNATIRAFKAEKLFMQGLQLSHERNFRDAIDIFDQVIELNADHPRVYEARGEAYYKLKDYERAINDYLIAVEQNPNDAEIWNSAGVASAKLGMYRAAAAYFDEAVKINPSYTMAQQNYDNAIKHLEEGDQNIASNWDPFGNRPDVNYGSNPRPGYDRPIRPSPVRPISGTGSSDINNPRPRPRPFTSGSNSNNPLIDDDFSNANPIGPSRSNQQEYRYTESQIEVGLRTDTYISIDQVRVTHNSTLVSFTINSLGDRTFPTKMAPTGSTDAFYLTTRDFKKIYPLRNIKNLPGWPNQPFSLKPGEDQLFIAEFDRLDDDVFTFHILEGKTEREEAWNFYDVKIKP